MACLASDTCPLRGPTDNGCDLQQLATVFHLLLIATLLSSYCCAPLTDLLRGVGPVGPVGSYSPPPCPTKHTQAHPQAFETGAGHLHDFWQWFHLL
jgi:hypothetical protein